VFAYLVGLVSGGGGSLALVTRGELREVSVVVSLPKCPVRRWMGKMLGQGLHLVVEDLGLASLGLGDQSIVEDIEDILADLLELGLDLLAVVADGGDVLVRAFGFLLLLNGGDDSPRGPSCTDHVLVCDREKVSFVNRELAAELGTS